MLAVGSWSADDSLEEAGEEPMVRVAQAKRIDIQVGYITGREMFVLSNQVFDEAVALQRRTSPYM